MIVLMHNTICFQYVDRSGHFLRSVIRLKRCNLNKIESVRSKCSSRTHVVESIGMLQFTLPSVYRTTFTKDLESQSITRMRAITLNFRIARAINISIQQPNLPYLAIFLRFNVYDMTYTAPNRSAV